MLVKCAECGADVSDSAVKCSQCGKQLKKLKRGFFGKFFLWLFYLFNILMLLWVIAGVNAASEDVRIFRLGSWERNHRLVYINDEAEDELRICFRS